MKVQKPRWS